jgi:signal peptidase I
MNREHEMMEPVAPEVMEERPAGEGHAVLRFIFDVLETLVLSLVLFLAINAVSARIRVDGSSMEPTLHSGEFILVNKLAYRFGSPHRGDIVVFHFPGNLSQDYIKRVIGLPGDEITIANGKVSVNGETLSEDYIAAPPRYSGTWIVPPDSVFVLGDNRNNSSDSHSWGPVEMDYVLGEAVFVYWPPQEWGMIERPLIAEAAH